MPLLVTFPIPPSSLARRRVHLASRARTRAPAGRGGAGGRAGGAVSGREAPGRDVGGSSKGGEGAPPPPPPPSPPKTGLSAPPPPVRFRPCRLPLPLRRCSCRQRGAATAAQRARGGTRPSQHRTTCGPGPIQPGRVAVVIKTAASQNKRRQTPNHPNRKPKPTQIQNQTKNSNSKRNKSKQIKPGRRGARRGAQRLPPALALDQGPHAGEIRSHIYIHINNVYIYRGRGTVSVGRDYLIVTVGIRSIADPGRGKEWEGEGGLPLLLGPWGAHQNGAPRLPCAGGRVPLFFAAAAPLFCQW